MTYFGFLLRFLLVPILLLAGVLFYRWPRPRPGLALGVKAIGLHILLALVYTTPWDNYLVATGVWSYRPELVTGQTIGFVPVEEYLFFILQPLLTGLWLLFLVGSGRFARPATSQPPVYWRTGLTAVLLIAWLAAAIALLAGWQAATYLALILVWALPPVGLQLAFGADILWQHGRLALFTIVSATLYLSLADALAIDGGTWTINPAQSFHLLLGGVLPVEEFIFFLVTNVLITFGVILLLAPASQARRRHWLRPYRLVQP